MSDDYKDPYAQCDPDEQPKTGTDRRTFLKGLGVAAASLGLPIVLKSNDAIASTSAYNSVKHLLYIRLAGGFRFTTAFNADVHAEFNPFGLADTTADGTEWGVSKLLERAPYLDGDNGQALRDLGMKPVNEISDQMAVMPCVDHEPFAGRADGNHGTGLERFQKGYVGTGNSFFTMINYGLRQRYADARESGEIVLPAFSLDDSGMAVGTGKYAGYRPPVLRGDGFDSFGFDAASSLPDWARDMSQKADERFRDRVHDTDRTPIEAYMQTREATKKYSDVFNSEALKIRNGSDEKIDGISNRELAAIFGDGRAGRRVRLALRLFHFGSAAVYMNQGGYDYHSGEQNALPRTLEDLNRLISGLPVALKMMQHPAGGTYWDHTLVVMGSEFGRTARGNKFNSARGSDHGGDLATRWMSMPVMGGLVDNAGNGGRRFGETRNRDLKATGQVYSYRSVLKTLMDVLGCDHQEFFPADEPFEDLFV